MPKYIINVEFAVEADDDCDAENKLDYALDHSPLIAKENGVEVVPNGVTIADTGRAQVA